MALVHDDEVEVLNRDLGVVDDWERLLWGKGRLRLEHRRLLRLLIVLLVIFQDGIQSLDGRNTDFAGRVNRVPRQPLDNVFLGELVVLAVGTDVLLKLVDGLFPEIVPVNEKEDTLRATELDEAVAEGRGGEPNF